MSDLDRFRALVQQIRVEPRHDLHLIYENDEQRRFFAKYHPQAILVDGRRLAGDDE